MNETYKNIIDELVEMCKNGQGNIGAKRAVNGIWNTNAKADYMEDQHEINLLLKKLTDSERRVLADMLSHQVQMGVFETLKVLENNKIEPFIEGYEGSPYHDFIGRMCDWKWPK